MLAGALLLGFSSCSDDIGDVNVDPNEPTAVPAENLLTQAQYRLNNTLWSRGYNAEWGMLMVQQWSQNEYAEESRFQVDGNNFNNEWVNLYANVLKELRTAAETVDANVGLDPAIKANQSAIIEILNVYTFHNLTDAYGDIPYSQSLDPDENANPSYETQSAIYLDLVARMRTSLASMDPGQPSFASGDLIYGGDVASWWKFGNSLLLRIAMRMVDADASAASSVISSLTPDMLLSSNADNAMFNFDPNPDVANPLFLDADPSQGDRDDFSVSDILVDNLTSMGDPRLTVYADTNATGDYVGIPSGLTDAEAVALKPNSSRPFPSLRTATAPAVMMDYAEVSFLLSEAYERGLLTGDAAMAYDAGVTASMEYWGFTDATAVADYLAANPYDAANWKQSLGWQKWIAFYMNGPQAWAEWRRLDHPVLTVPAAAVLNEIPVRLPYPIDEQTGNSSFTSTTPDDLSTKMWWDMN